MTSLIDKFFRQRPNPAWICEGEHLRFTDVNSAAVERYGLPEATFKTLSLLELQPGIAPCLSSVRIIQKGLQAGTQELWLPLAKRGPGETR